MENVENAIDGQPMGEDEDPTLEELIPLMKIPSQVDGHWLFSMVLNRHSHKVSWIEIREFLIEWIEARDEVTDYFEELIEKRDREKLTEKALDDITGKLDKIKVYFDNSTNATREELSKKTKEELVEFISSQEWYHANSKKDGDTLPSFNSKNSRNSSYHKASSSGRGHHLKV